MRTFPVLTLWSLWWGTPGFRWFWCSWQTCRCCWSPPSGPSVGWLCRSRHRLECMTPQHNTPEWINAIKIRLLRAPADIYGHLERSTKDNQVSFYNQPLGQMSVQGMHILKPFSSTSILLLGHALTQELWSTTKLSTTQTHCEPRSIGGCRANW